jgi:hypothetical protein
VSSLVFEIFGMNEFQHRIPKQVWVLAVDEPPTSFRGSHLAFRTLYLAEGRALNLGWRNPVPCSPTQVEPLTQRAFADLRIRLMFILRRRVRKHFVFEDNKLPSY